MYCITRTLKVYNLINPRVMEEAVAVALWGPHQTLTDAFEEAKADSLTFKARALVTLAQKRDNVDEEVAYLVGEEDWIVKTTSPGLIRALHAKFASFEGEGIRDITINREPSRRKEGAWVFRLEFDSAGGYRKQGEGRLDRRGS